MQKMMQVMQCVGAAFRNLGPRHGETVIERYTYLANVPEITGCIEVKYGELLAINKEISMVKVAVYETVVDWVFW